MTLDSSRDFWNNVEPSGHPAERRCKPGERRNGVRPQNSVDTERIDGAVKEVRRDKSGNKHPVGIFCCSSLYENNIVQVCNTHARSHTRTCTLARQPGQLACRPGADSRVTIPNNACRKNSIKEEIRSFTWSDASADRNGCRGDPGG